MNYYGMLALGPRVKKLAKDGYYGMSKRVSCKRSAILCQQPLTYVYEMWGGRVYVCVVCVCVCFGGDVRVYYGMARRWAVAQVTRARALEGGVASGCLSDEGAGVARETWGGGWR